MNSIFQSFGGMCVHTMWPSCAASDLVHISGTVKVNRSGEDIQDIIDKHGNVPTDPYVSIDNYVHRISTLPIPPMPKLHKKEFIRQMCPKCASRQAKTSCVRATRTSNNWSGTPITARTPKKKKKAETQNGTPRHLPWTVGQEPFERSCPRGPSAGELELYKRVLAHERNSKNKIYSPAPSPRSIA